MVRLAVARPVALLATVLSLVPPGAAQATDSGSGWDDALRWEGARHATFGPTGRRLFASQVRQAPGCAGRFHYGAAQAEIIDPILVEVLRDGEPLELELEGSTWFPSHLEERWRAGDLLLHETELITDGDMLVDELRLSNEGTEPLELQLHVRGGATPRRDRSRSRMVPVDLSSVADLAPVSGTPLFTDRPAPDAVWAEAEDFQVAVAGSGASAGLYVHDVGSTVGAQFLCVLTAPPLEHPTLLVRYRISGDGPARFTVEVDRQPMGELELFAPEDWRFARVPLSEVPAGRVLVSFVSGTAAPVDIDGLFLAEEGFEPGPLPDSGAYLATVGEQLELYGGAREIDGVRYVLPSGAEVRQPALVALRGGLEGDRAHDFPPRVSVALPDERPALTTLHLLLRSETPRGRGPADQRRPSITLRLDDGSAETIAWPDAEVRPPELPASLHGRAECLRVDAPGLDDATLQLSYDAPPGRAVLGLELEAGDGPQVPVLLAATLEVPVQTGRLPVLVGTTSLEGQPAELVLAATGAIPARPSADARSLTLHVSLEPGASHSLRALLATGPRPTQCLLQALDAVEDDGLVERHRADYERWFVENVPAFSCSDPYLERAWRQRWALVRRELLRLDLPDFSMAVAYEGTCCAEHARVTPRAASFALRELRWLRDPAPAQGTVRALLKRQRPDGLLFAIAPGPLRWGEAYTAHDLAASAIGVWEVTGSSQYLQEVLDLLQRDLEAALARLDPQADEIPGPFLVSDTAVTGTPGRRLFDLAGLHREPVEPVEVGVLLGRAARALALGHAVLGHEAEASRLRALADQLDGRVQLLCWDDKASWFLSLDAQGRRIGAREIPGILPLASGSALDRVDAGLATLFSPDGFWARHPVRSIARADAPEEQPANPLSWDGPVHGEALTWALDAVARAARSRREPQALERFARLLDAVTHAHFEDDALERPITREAWDPDTGRGAGCVDVLRSAYADLLVQYVAGVVPRADGVLELDPLATHLEHFRFAGLLLRGRLVDVTWDRPDGVRRYEALGLPEGFSVDVDGVRRHHGEALEHVVLD